MISKSQTGNVVKVLFTCDFLLVWDQAVYASCLAWCGQGVELKEGLGSGLNKQNKPCIVLIIIKVYI